MPRQAAPLYSGLVSYQGHLAERKYKGSGNRMAVGDIEEKVGELLTNCTFSNILALASKFCLLSLSH